MCRSFDLTEEDFDEAWKLMPKQDRAFISALSYLNELFEDDKLRYGELPIEMQQFIAAADRGTCFSLLAECLAALLGTSVMVRVKRRRRHRRSDPKDADNGDSEADTRDDTHPDESSRTRQYRRSRRRGRNACGSDGENAFGGSGDGRKDNREDNTEDSP